jgi:hypothetical protein
MGCGVNRGAAMGIEVDRLTGRIVAGADSVQSDQVLDIVENAEVPFQEGGRKQDLAPLVRVGPCGDDAEGVFFSGAISVLASPVRAGMVTAPGIAPQSQSPEDPGRQLLSPRRPGKCNLWGIAVRTDFVYHKHT